MQLSKTEAGRDAAVRALAHQIWEEEGCPDGRADDHWLRAVTLVDSIEPPRAKTGAASKARVPAKKKLQVS